MTRLGDDAIGQTIRAELVAERIEMSASVATPRARSPVSTVAIDADGERMLVHSIGSDLAEIVNLLSEFDGVLADTRWPRSALLTLNAAREMGKPAVLDAEPPLLPDLLHAAAHVVFLAQGLREFTGIENLSDSLVSLYAKAWVGVTGARLETQFARTERPHGVVANLSMSSTLWAQEMSGTGPLHWPLLRGNAKSMPLPLYMQPRP